MQDTWIPRTFVNRHTPAMALSDNIPWGATTYHPLTHAKIERWHTTAR